MFSKPRYSKAKAVNSIVRHVAEILGIKTNEELEDLYRFVGSKYSHPDFHNQENCLVL